MAEAPAIDTGAAPVVAPSNGVQHWSATLPADQREIPAVATSPDLPSFVKRFTDQHSNMSRLETELKSRPKLPGKDSKPDELSAFKKSVYEAGVFKAPPENAAAYQITKPENIPDWGWSEKHINGFRELAHKHGTTQEALSDFLAFHTSMIQDQEREVNAMYESNKEAVKQAVTERWKQTGRSYDDMMNLAVNGLEARVAPEVFEAMHKPIQLGDGKVYRIIDDPSTLEALAIIGEAYQIDSGRIGGHVTDQGAKAEATDIQTNPDNPKHKLYAQGDKATVEYVTNLLKKADGSTVTL